MKIDFRTADGILCVSLDGRLDTATAPLLESFLSERYDGICGLVLDCERLTYVSSAGLRVLLTARKRIKGDVKLIRVCELVMEVVDMTGFTDILQIEA